MLSSRIHDSARLLASAASAAALLCLALPANLAAQTAQPQPVAQANRPGQQGSTPLPTIRVEARRARRRHRAARRTRLPPAPPPAEPAVAEPSGAAGAEGAPRTATGGTTVGYIASRLSSATKTDTPVINIPQSITVLTHEFIKDQAFQTISDAVRYVPGVIPHQGESNRDDVLIRGQRSNADFYVNGIRDDVQYFRDLYNIERIEVLKGPNAMIFGRGGGGGVINRVLKAPEWRPIGQVTVQGGEFRDGRVVLDVGNALNANIAGRFNAVYEQADSYRRFVNLERYGVNPTVTFKPAEGTTVALSYEYFHHQNVTDRGIPSQNGRPYPTDPSTFFGNPRLNRARVDANIATAVIEHETDYGLKIRNASRYANYEKFYQNVFPGGPVNAAGTSVNLTAYNNQTDRENLFNQTDVTYKFDTGFLRHTLLGGLELGRQSGLAFRQSGRFNGVSPTLAVSPLDPVTYVPVTFTNLASDSNSRYRLNLGAAYIQDQIEITRHLQLIGGLRFDRFDFESRDRRTGAVLGRIDDLVSPRVGVVVKPREDMSLYGSYSISYLPSVGDQFSRLTPGTAIAEPEKFENKEVGFKWDISPRLQFTTALYILDRTNQRLADPNNPGFFILSGATRSKGFETGLSGYVTDLWQIALGYAYTDARIVGATSATIVAGNRVGLVPYNTFTVWNKYQFTPRWAGGIGIIHQTDAYASSDDSVRLPGFTRVDAAVYYKVNEHIKAQVNIENVFDIRYIATADGNNNITPGSPRAIRGVLTATF